MITYKISQNRDILISLSTIRKMSIIKILSYLIYFWMIKIGISLICKHSITNRNDHSFKFNSKLNPVHISMYNLVKLLTLLQTINNK